MQKHKPRDGDLESKLGEFIEMKKNYALYLIHLIPGHQNRFDSMFSEINHSSVLSYLNDGYKYANTYHEYPFMLIRDLLHCQRKSVMKKTFC